MKQAIYETYGNAKDVIKVVEMESQALQDGEARLQILRTPINPSDIAQIEGQYGFQPALPAPAGMEGIGKIVEIQGDGPEVGTLVLLADPPGAWSTEKILSISELVAVPHADINQLSMLCVNPATAYLLLNQYVQLREGDWMIQSAGNSAVARYVTQLAKVKGIKVASVVRRESAVGDARAAGADEVFVDGADLAERVTARLPKKPVLAIDAVAGETFGRLVATLENGGCAVLYGNMSHSNPSLPDSPLIFNNVRISGFWLVNWLQSATQEEQSRVYEELTGLILQGHLNAPIDAVFELDQIHEALEHTVKGHRSGKVLLAPNGIDIQ
ncbi:MAG: zinc-dependent alcohol dehydrogenase family protein [Pseudomonadota bacterium]